MGEARLLMQTRNRQTADASAEMTLARRGRPHIAATDDLFALLVYTAETRHGNKDSRRAVE